MSSGERPIGAAKGKQSDTEACAKPPSSVRNTMHGHGTQQVEFLCPGHIFVVMSPSGLVADMFLLVMQLMLAFLWFVL